LDNPKPKVTLVKSKPAETPAPQKQIRAALAINASMNAAGVITEYASTPFGEQGVDELFEKLKGSMKAIHGGDLKQAESMLMGQALALQSMFVHMSRRVLNQGLQRHFEANFAMALKAQNQCRMTLETLAEIKNPRQVAFVRAGQANIANGPQQVNNGAGAISRAENIENQPNELLALEPRDGSTQVDFGATATPIGAHSKVAPLGAVKRTANTGGKGSCEP
jgi:hypothetical protein